MREVNKPGGDIWMIRVCYAMLESCCIFVIVAVFIIL